MGLHKEHPNRSDTSTHLRKRSTPDQFNVQSHICTEIPNTPTQRSSGPLSIPSALFKVQSHLTRDNSQHDDGLMLIEPARPTTIASSAVLCSACRKQRAFVKKRAMDVECHRCQKKTLFAEFGEVEIPETPEAISIIQIEQRGNASMLASSTTPSTFRSLDDRSSLHWFRSELVANTPKITQRKIGDLEHIEAAFASGTCPKYEADTNELSRDFSPKAGPLDHSIEKRATAPAKIIATNALAKGPIKQSNGASQRTAYTNDTSPHVSSKLMTSEVQEPIVISSSLSERYDNSVSEDNTENIVDACPEHLPFHISDWIGSARAEQLSSDSGESPVSVSQSVTKASTEVRYTMRKLTILALVAANGARLTSSQIVMWIAQKFSYLKLGEGEWETSIRSALSLFDEFQGYKIPGTRGRRGQKMWGFTNTHLRAQYEKEYSEYRTAANYPTPPLGRQPATEEASTSVSLLVCERNGAVPPMHLPESTTQQPQTNTKTEILYQASSPRQYENIDMAFMPFERSKPCRRTRALAFDSNSSQKASSLGTHPRALHSSIEAMTDVEKAHKIAEIKARSPRKRYFGSDHRLWHKRRHNLQDIHDERNGAWKRPSMMNKPKTRKEHDVHEGNEDYRTLRQVFDLPDNIIPMNDGQGELAFRDAVMVNGILPRPRNIYKVGKMFGGKLTVRAA
ncbi:hypothetical protein GQ44DRAFT_778591 [Phaeosphaeriaceae sp. PMI808]|nr:hypothetical protein GQ44DRAFT_778591 [Phaeosphaeriaceae sp. PMI808]